MPQLRNVNSLPMTLPIYRNYMRVKLFYSKINIYINHHDIYFMHIKNLSIYRYSGFMYNLKEPQIFSRPCDSDTSKICFNNAQ